MSPDGSNVYAGSNRDDAVVTYSRDTTTGQLTWAQTVQDNVDGVDGLEGVFIVEVSPDGNHLYAAGFDDDAIAVFSRDPVTGGLTFAQVVRDGQSGIDGLDGAHSVVVSPDGNHVYAAGWHDDAIAVFDRNQVSGELTFVQAVADGQYGIEGLDGAHDVTLSPDGRYLYAAGWNSNALTVFSRDAATGQLHFEQVVKDDENGVDGLLVAASVTVSPDGSHLYASGFEDDALVAFSRHSGSDNDLSLVLSHWNEGTPSPPVGQSAPPMNTLQPFVTAQAAAWTTGLDSVRSRATEEPWDSREREDVPPDRFKLAAPTARSAFDLSTDWRSLTPSVQSGTLTLSAIARVRPTASASKLFGVNLGEEFADIFSAL